MSAAVYITLDREIPGFDHVHPVCGKAIARNWETVNELARGADFPPLEHFVSASSDDLAGLIGEDAVGQSGVTIPPEQWFDPSLGLAAVRGLQDAVSRGSAGVDDPERVRHDLRTYEQVLLRADSDKVRFHLAFDF